MQIRFFLLCIFLFYTTDFTLFGAENRKDAISQIKEIKQENLAPGIIIEPPVDSTNENGRRVLIPVNLRIEPIAEIILICESSNPLEGVVENNRLLFNSANWNQTQYLSVKGIDDNSVDGDQTFAVKIEVTSSKDMGYARLPIQQIQIVNKDNDKAGFIVKTVKSITKEAGDKAAYTIRLTSKPVADVIIPIFSNNKREGIPGVDKLRITSENWDKEQLVSVSGKDDNIKDGSVTYKIVHGAAFSDDLEYRGKKPDDVSLINHDNDSAGIDFTVSNNITSEKGEESHININLNSEPVGEVLITATVSDLSEANVTPTQLVVNSRDWNVRQKFRIIPRDDLIDDDDQAYTITLSTRKSADKVYSSLSDQEIRMLNRDNDEANLVIVKYEDNTTESGKSGKIGIKLNSQPRSTVWLRLQSSNPQEGRLLLNELVFSENDWYQEKMVTVVGVDDKQADGSQVYSIIITPSAGSDAKFASLQPTHIRMTNTDNEEVGVTIKKSRESTSEDGETVFLSFALNVQPDFPVTIKLFSSDINEAMVQPAQLIFHPSNWNIPQIAVVTGQADGMVDGDKPYFISTSIDSEDKKITSNPPKIKLINIDTNSYSILVNSQADKTDEAGGVVSLAVRLNAQPTGQLQIEIESSDLTEGIPIPSQILFNRNNWNILQHVDIKGIDDDIKDGDIPYQIRLVVKNQEESGFESLMPVIIPIINTDNDNEGVTIRPINQFTSEDGETGKFAIKLNSEPTSSVIFIFTCSDVTECEMIDYHAAFFPNNWNKEQIISIKGVEDYTVDGDQEFYVSSLGAISKDTNYNKYPFRQIKFINRDKNRAGFSLGELKNRASEDGDSASFSLRLTSTPQSEVRLRMESSDESEGEIFPPYLVFTRENWNEDHPVTVIGKKDDIKDGDQDFDIIFPPAESEDSNYSGLFPEPLRITNRDSMRLALGLTLTQLKIQGELKNSIDDSTVIGLTAGYVMTRNIDFDLVYLQSNNTGSRTVNKYNLSNPMEYTLNYSALSLGGKYSFLKSLFSLYSKAGLDISFWELQSTNKLTRAEESNSGTSLGAYVGIGSDITFFGLILAGIDGSYHYMTRGLGNIQFTLSLKYPI
ncbi:hypothetical protein KJ966_04785 [bacterium]|nr:hypothetical protein [bacterium]